MSAPLPILRLDARTYDRALACVHCGLCLPACPTYAVTGHEADSPRGRIQLMRGLADGAIVATDSVRHHLDLCLDCRGCETACPSGVVYHELIEETRARFAAQEAQSTAELDLQSRFMQWIFFEIFTHPIRLKFALLPARLLQKTGLYEFLRKTRLFKLLPPQLRKMAQMLPPAGRLWPKRLPARTVPRATPSGPHHRDTGIPPMRATSKLNGPGLPVSETACTAKTPISRQRPSKTVGFFAGCIGSVMFDEVNRKAVELLAASGAEVIAPRAQVCCGAIHHHNGAHDPAQEMARRNIDTFLPIDGPGVDAIVTTVAGCGAMLREYDFLLRNDPAYAERAKGFAARVRDITEVLFDLGLPQPSRAVDETVTYHDACHLAHAQRVTIPPRLLLAQIPGMRMVPLSESDMCCGAAGTYNLTQPEMSTRLAERKLANLAATGATTCATGNVGCAMQIQSEANARGQSLTVVHPVELLHRAVFG